MRFPDWILQKMSLVKVSFLSSQACYLAPLKFSDSKPRRSRCVQALALPSPISASDDHINGQKWKEMTQEKIEIIKSLESWVEQSINQTFLKPVQSLWQPQDLLRDPLKTDEEFFQSIQEIRRRASEIPDEFYVCLVGNMITEEALPTYLTVFNTFEGVKDSTETRETGWARWSRQWTAEENRHGDLLNKYLYLSGRVDMRRVEETIQYLIRAGMHIGADNNTFCGLIYSSFQERATFISHGNTACHAKHLGDATLAKICGLIAADEKRHELAYTKIVEKLFEVDPNTTMLAFAFMMKRRITMPALLMFDGHDDNLFNHFSMVAQAIGVYTVKDYADIVEFLVERWNVEEASDGLTSEGRRAQDYVCRLAERLRKMEERVIDKNKRKKKSELTIPFCWIFNRKVTV